MSYDVALTIDTGGSEPLQVVECGNYTSNVSPMWAKALGRSLGDYDGAPCSEAAGPLAAGVRAMEANPDDYRSMGPSNGWGDYDGALKYLRGIAEACAANPRCAIWISR
jgi:hypothetical protein